jgi:rare lipoprotein A (peptidoglycan hydrolase)
MITAGIAGAQDTVPALMGGGPEATAAGGPATAVSLKGRHDVMAHRAVTFRGRVTPGGSRHVIVRVGGRRFRAHRIRVNAYRPAEASYYGPGLYGGGLACGGTLTPSKLGVANKTLPCGASVTLRYHRHTVTVPVIDRGPFAGNREYDLTAATKAKLGFPSTGTVLTTR